MYLSKLEIIGFKSFAHRTLLKFDAGMTSIVGPNGCGKTNVVDAIRWALGEQKAGTLRSDVMENVIFNGTRTRKPLGMAEVSLTIENTKGILPTEYSEVTITRRLFRSGESEYLLNKTQCRLKDIIELFMDTGMGANAYSVIELKMIETILSDRTDERRKLFEEAAGVTKYKARRKEALRRLDQVSADLSRVDDIVKEVTKTVASLERQAEKAKKHSELTEELRKVEVELLEREYVTTLEKLEPLRARLEEAESNKNRISDELAKFESMLDVIEREEEEIEDQLTSSERGVKEKTEIIARTRETIIGTEERIRSLTAQKERAILERDRLEKQQQELTERLSALEENLIKAQASRDELEAEKLEKEKIKAEADAVVREKRSELQQARDALYALLNQRNQKSTDLERRRAKIEELERRINRFDDEYLRIDNRTKELETELASVAGERESALQQVALREQEMQQAQAEKDNLRARIDELQNLSFTVQNEIGKKISKIEFYTGLVEQGIGAGEGTEFLLSNAGWAKSEPVTVADAMTTSLELRAAFESALGEIAHYLVVETKNDAFEAVEMLRHSQKGKATFVCLDRVPTMEAPALSLSPGCESALDVAKFSDRYTNLFRMLLGPVVIAPTINDCFAVLDSSPQVEKCVTPEGEVVTCEGIVRGGSKKQNEGILIGKREQINELEVDVANLKAQLEQYEAEIADVNRAFEAIFIKQYNDRIRQAEEERRKIDNRNSQLEYELKRLGEQRANLAHDEERAKTELQPLSDSLAATIRKPRNSLHVHSCWLKKLRKSLQKKYSVLHRCRFGLLDFPLRFAELNLKSSKLQTLFNRLSAMHRSVLKNVSVLSASSKSSPKS